MIRERITVDIDVQSADMCGEWCHMIIPMRGCRWFCKAFITELWTDRNDPIRCDECKASAINNYQITMRGGE